MRRSGVSTARSLAQSDAERPVARRARTVHSVRSRRTPHRRRGRVRRSSTSAAAAPAPAASDVRSWVIRPTVDNASGIGTVEATTDRGPWARSEACQPEDLSSSRRRSGAGLAADNTTTLGAGASRSRSTRTWTVGQQQRGEHRGLAREPSVADEVSNVGTEHRLRDVGTPSRQARRGFDYPCNTTRPVRLLRRRGATPGPAARRRSAGRTQPGVAPLPEGAYGASVNDRSRSDGSSPHGRSWKPPIGLSTTGSRGELERSDDRRGPPRGRRARSSSLGHAANRSALGAS